MFSASCSDHRLALAALAAIAAGACGAEAGDSGVGDVSRAPAAEARPEPWLAHCPLTAVTARPLAWQPCDATGDDRCQMLAHDQVLAEAPIAAPNRHGELALAIALGRAGEGEPRHFWAATLGGRGIAAATQSPESQTRCGYYLEDVFADHLRLGSRAGAAGALVSLEASRAAVLFEATDDQRSNWDGRLRRTAPRRDLELYEAGWRSPTRVWSGAERGNLGATPAIDLGERIVLEVSVADTRRVMLWNEDDTAAPLGSPHAHDAAGNLGSDGETLVWSEGRDRIGLHVYRNTWVVTAPAGEPETARRIGSDGTTAVGGAPFRVGCGRAVHRVGAAMHLVELDSGRAQQLPPPPTMTWGEPVALTCDELVATVVRETELELVRVPLQDGYRRAATKGRATMPKRSPSPALTRSATSATRSTLSTLSK